MGARVNFGFKDGANVINLYSHWGGDGMFDAMGLALDRSQPRWTDPAYGTRIAVSTIVNVDWMAETGYGLMANSLGDNEYPYLLADFNTKQVYLYPATGAHTGRRGFESVMAMTPEKDWSFEQFVDEFSPAKQSD